MPLNRVGKRGRERAHYNAELNKLEITWCELRLEGCTGRMGLTWAHSRKSRFITCPEHWMEAARACLHCHMLIEAMSHACMMAIVLAVIGARGIEHVTFIED